MLKVGDLCSTVAVLESARILGGFREFWGSFNASQKKENVLYRQKLSLQTEQLSVVVKQRLTERLCTLVEVSGLCTAVRL